MRCGVLILVALFGCSWAYGDEKVFRVEGAVVSYEDIDDAYARAIATTVAAARQAAVDDWGFDMPRTIRVAVRKDPRQRVRLFNDGQDFFSLTLRSEDDLRKPTASGVYHVYGLCHEVGHLVMYRALPDRRWMSTSAAEGWAHYVGSRIVDAVYERKRQSLWPDSYDYLADGSRRLDAQLADEKPRPIVKGAALWKDLAAIVGDRGLAPVFAAWAKAEIDPADPGAALRKALLATCEDDRLAEWWNRAETLMVLKQPRSGFAARRAQVGDLTGHYVEQSHDDGAAAGKNSIAGSGHAVKFTVVGDSWYLTAIRVHGSRYGHPRPPSEDFHVWLCDKDFKVIEDFPFPYDRFARGASRWVTLRIPPVNVPQEFILCVGFNPSGTKGVFVSRDREGEGASLTGLPEQGCRPFSQGDWLIRACVDQLKMANPLDPGE